MRIGSYLVALGGVTQVKGWVNLEDRELPDGSRRGYTGIYRRVNLENKELPGGSRRGYSGIQAGQP